MQINKKSIATCLLTVSFLQSGCFPFTYSSKNQPLSEEDLDPFVPVQDYTGEGYTLDGGGVTQPIADENLPEIEEAVKRFFSETYNTDVVVHNVVGARNGATVFVESVGKPHFYTYAVVPIDVGEKEVLLDEVWSQKGQVEDAIRTGVYAMIYEEEINNLNTFLEEVVEEYYVIGRTPESIANVSGNGFNTSIYYLSSIRESFDGLEEFYIKDPSKTSEEWTEIYPKDQLEAETIRLTIQLYMEHEGQPASTEVFDHVVQTIEEGDEFSPGYYSVYVNTNKIDSRNLQSERDTSLKRSNPDYIIK